MKKPIKPGTPNASIRRRAEERFNEQQNRSNSKTPHSASPIPRANTDTQKLIYELQVHQIELEMQNEELSRSQAEVETGLERYTDLYDFAPVGYFTLTRDGTISQCNLTGACLLGVERARLVNRRFGLFVSEADRPDFNAFLERVMEGKAEEVCDVALLKEEAGPLWVHIEALASGDRQACRAVVMDITARKQLEDALRESEEKMRSIFRAAPLGIGGLVNGVFVEVNQRFCDMTGYTSNELIGRSARTVYLNDADYEYVGEEKYRQIAEMKTGAVETRFRRKDGEAIDVLLSSTPIDVAHLSRGITFTALDITARKQVEKALQKRADELTALNALGRAVNATLSLEQTIAAALQGILNAVYPDLACLFLREGDRLILKEALPPSAREWLDAIPEHRLGECLCGLAMRERKPIYSPNMCNDSRCTREACKKAGMKSFAALPLINGDEMIGVMGLASAVERHYERQAGFLETLAGQVSVAAANARLFELAQRELAERKRAEEALSESEEKHRILLEQSPDPIFSFTPEGRYRYVNRAFAEGVGKSVEDIVGRMIWDVFPKEEADQRFAALSRVFKTGQKNVIEVRVPRADGDQYYVTTITPIKGAKGKVLSVICSSKNITERKGVEESLRQAAEKRRELEFIVNQSPAMVFLWKATEGWPVEYVSENIRRFGYLPADFYSGRVSFVSIVHPDDLQRVVAEVTAYSREPGREQFVQEYRIVSLSGQIHWLDNRTWIRRNEKGEITHYQGIVVDITERKRVERALWESEERYRKIFENSIEGIFQSALDGHYLTVNPSFARMFGFDSPKQMIGAVTNISSLYVHPEVREQIVHLLRTVGEVKNYEAELNRRDGTRIWISLHAKTARDEKGEPLFFDGTVEDITERKQVEEKLRHVLTSVRCILWHAVVTDRVEGGFHWDFRITNEEAAEKMFPLPLKPGQRYSDVWRDGTPPEDIERMDRTSTLAIRQGRAGYVQEFRLCLPSGEIRWLFEDAHIQPIGLHSWLVVGVCTDITERKKAEEAIQEQMDELRRWHEVTLGRETRVLDLKREVNELLAKAGQPPRYESAMTDGDRSDRNEEYGVRNAE